MSIATLLAASSIPAQATENMIYVPVSPCRLADTRATASGAAIPADTSRNFLVSGTVTSQGGNPDGCPAPRPGVEPLAISAYVLAIPPNVGSAAGILTAFPSGQAAPAPGAGSTVNFNAGQVIGNTTTITLCDPAGTCPADGEFAILARTSAEHVVVDVQGYFYPATGTCPDDMVAAGSVCVDKYEASLVDASGTATTSAACNADGSDCGADAAGVNPAIFAQSVDGVLPDTGPSWFQAAMACANVGKRLPSVAEWQMAAAGTVAVNCNAAGGGSLANTGSFTDCVSTAGAFDMVGNLWEWTADLTPDALKGGDTSANSSIAAVFGESYVANIDPTPGTDSLFIPNSGAIAKNAVVGFRCVR